jgi:cytochrome b subunit of formate dehydrogenase
MINGTVTKKWAWTHHPGWYRAVTGRDPREDYEREKRHQNERARTVESWEQEQDTRDNS